MLSNTSFWNHLRFRLESWEKYLFSHSCRTRCAMCLDCSGCHQKKKGSLAYISIQFCWTSTILNDQEIVKLVKKSWGAALRWAGSGNKATSSPSAEAAPCHRETLLPASKPPLWSGTKLCSPLSHIQKISTMSATFLSVNKWSQKSSENSCKCRNSFQICCMSTDRHGDIIILEDSFTQVLCTGLWKPPVTCSQSMHALTDWIVLIAAPVPMTIVVGSPK